MAYDTAKGMLYLHSNSPSAVIHRDLKSPNLLVTADWTVKVADFNLSRLAEEYNNNSNGEQEQPDGPTQPRWLAPEVMRGKPFTEASDVFSFAVVLWELLTWKLPWSRGIASHGGVMNAVLRGDRLRIPEAGELPGDSDKFPGLDEYVELMKECWVDDPVERPGFESIAIRLGEMVGSQLSYVRQQLEKE
jgi:serine/threonine protein kinase